MVKSIEKIDNFAKLIYQLLRSDRDVTLGVAGMTGEGKTTFVIQLARAYSKFSKIPFSLNNLTWGRKELMRWIDGDPESEANLVTGLKPGQLPEYSVLIPDELFKMFFKRNWFDEAQINAIAVLNMCRDRHLLIAGNIPNFWDLDGSFTSRVRFYCYIPKRGVAWIFQQENNPFCKDNWNIDENKKLFRKIKNPYNLPNFLFEINYNDLDIETKNEYLALRVAKRGEALLDNRSPKGEMFRDIKAQRNKLLLYVADVARQNNLKITNKTLAVACGISEEAVRRIKQGLL